MKKVAVLTSGGDSPGMNAAVRAVVRTAVANGLEAFGVYRGYQGLINGDIRPMSARSVSGIIDRGGTVIRTARCAEFHEPAGRATAAQNLRAHGIDGLVVIGGDGSYRGAQVLHAEQGIACIGLPGTIDNDIGGTDFTIGFDTAMNTAMQAIDRLRDTAASHDRIFFVEVMGRHSGYLSMIAGIAGGAEEILVPESPTDVKDLAALLRRGRANGKLSMIVVVAEGDDAGNALEIMRKLAEISEFKDARATVIGHLQRGGSPTAFDRVLASRMGVRAVQALMAGETNCMVAIQGTRLALLPFSVAIDQRSLFDPELVQVARVLAV